MDFVRLVRNAPWFAAIGGAVICQPVFAGAPAGVPGDSAPRVDARYPHPQPPYPDAAQTNGEQGEVVLDVRVLANGTVRYVKIDQSSGFDDLDNAAIEGVLRWRFLPAIRDGDTASEWTQVRIVYRLPTAPPRTPQPPA